MTQTRGVRNNNPGNIDHNAANEWQGELPVDPDIEKRFARFDSPENGIRALTKLLRNYYTKYNLRTVEAIINRWAPGNENDTEAYVEAVAKSLGVKPTEIIDVTSNALMIGLVNAIIRHENAGYQYPVGIVLEGVSRGLR